MPAMWRSASSVAILVACVSSPALAQGKSQASHGNGNGKKGATTPSQTVLAPAAAVSSGPAASPFAWVDGASLVAPGTVWAAVSVANWHGGGLSETSFPVIDGAIGLAPRVQLGATVPHVVGSSDPGGSSGGLGTAFFSAKVAVIGDEKTDFRLAIAPTLEVLSSASVLAAPADRARVQFGLPVSMDFDRGGSRFYASSGYFSPGVWYIGGGLARQVATRIGVAVSLSRAWSSSTLDPTAPALTRNDLSGSASYDFTPHFGAYGSIGHTVGTTEESAAGMTVSGGITLTAVSKALTK